MKFALIGPRRARKVGLRLLAVSAIVATASSLGLVALAAPAQADTAGSSQITVKWKGENPSELQAFQVDHKTLLTNAQGNDAGSGHWDDFKDLEITVSKTSGLRDEAISVTSTGMRATTSQNGDINPSNYLQMFQCWGPDPLDPGFAETCQYGAWSKNASLGKAGDEMAGVVSGYGTANRSALGEVPFRTPSKQVSKPLDIGGVQVDGTAQFFDATTSNEQPIAYIGADNTSRTTFAVQTAATQPYLGCGDKKLAGTRCWLVVVPRGTHSGTTAANVRGSCVPTSLGWQPYGAATFQQVGSPLDPACTFFQDRVVIPLDFAEPTSGCAPGSPETRLLGSELIAEAVSSWQRGLCADEGTAYSLTTNSGDVTRAQLLSGQARLAVVANRFEADNIGIAGPDLLEEAHLAYAPIANAALTVSFVASQFAAVGADPAKVTVWRDLKMNPRLLAKVLTQSYNKDSPNISASGSEPPMPTNAQYMAGKGVPSDPEWAALGNPNLFAGAQGGTFVVSGPQGEDVVELLWRYIQSDADAVSFLRGEPDPWGQTINPYYLPSTNPKAAGGGLPYDLAVDPIDTFPRADQRVVPSLEEARTKYRGMQLDSVTMLPYSSNLSANAARIQRADTRYTFEWDPNKDVSPGVRGQWSPRPAQIGATRHVAGVADLASAARYAVDSMQLALPLSEKTTEATVSSARTFVAPAESSMTAAVSAMPVDAATGFATPDFTKLPSDAYPLTATLYAAVNVTSPDLDEAEREQLADFIEYAGGPGNTRGPAAGQLPEGYAPVTPAQLARSAAAVELIRNPPVDPVDESAMGAAEEVAPIGAAATGTAAPASTVPGASAATDTNVTSTVAVETQATVAGVGGAQAALGGALMAGLVGLGASPFLLRRRGAA